MKTFFHNFSKFLSRPIVPVNNILLRNLELLKSCASAYISSGLRIKATVSFDS